MAGDILFILLASFIGLRIAVSGVNLITSPVLRVSSPRETPLVSVLIPARNEEQNLPGLLDALRRQDYPHTEVLVYDDGSTDRTAAIVEAAMSQHASLRLIRGGELPEGWLGKNNACHQLSLQAQGKYLLFMDADVTLHPGAVSAAIAEMERHELQLLSLFPDQEMKTTGELSVVPMMHYILLTLLPLRLVQHSRFPSLAAANGQFMLFEAAAYKKHRWHERMKKCIVEDIAIMQGVKRAGEKGSVLLANGLVQCRMYQNYVEGVKGFSKNLLAGFKESVAGLSVFLLLTVLAYPFAGPLLSTVQVLILLLLIVLMRTLQSIACRQRLIPNLLLHPVMMFTMLWVGIRSMIQKINGKRNWKGRLLDI